MSGGYGCSWNASIRSVIRPSVKNFIQLAAKILMKGAVGYRGHLFNLLNFIVYRKKTFNVWICYVCSLLYLLLEKGKGETERTSPSSHSP